MNEYQHQDLLKQNNASSPVPITVPPVAFTGKPSEKTMINSRMKSVFISAIFLSLTIANFIFMSGMALGFSVTVLVTEILIFCLLPFPSNRKTLAISVFLAVSIIGLGAAFTIFSDMILGAINFLVIIFLLLMQLLIQSQTLPYDWDHLGFAIELCISPFIRPFVSLPSLIKAGRLFKINKQDDDNNDKNIPKSTLRTSTVLKILIGLLLAFPVMIIAILLLSSADLVFKSNFDSVIRFLSKMSVNEIISTIITAAIIFPFLFSMMVTYLSKWKATSILTEPLIAFSRKFSIDSIIAATFLFCVNLLYGIFAYVQFTSLFFSFQLILPENVTYAQYARQGFFQLAAIAFINLLIVIVSILFTKRKSIAGLFVRIMSVMLIFFTFVQLASATYRMKMYIDAYSLSKLRVFVSIFMGLIVIFLILALFKEFYTKFKFFKTCVIISIVVLLFTNYINTDALIAKYNTDRFLHNNIKIDSEYLLNGLSYDAIIYVIPLMDVKDDKIVESVKHDLLEIYAFNLANYDNVDFRRYSFSKDNAKKAIEDYFGSTLATELEAYNIYCD